MKYYVKVEKDVKLFVEDLNPSSENTILFIHGWPLNHNIYEYQFNKLPDMGYRCISIDLRGYGRSDRPIDGYDYDTMARDINRVIKALKLENITLVGHSMGGAISIRYVSNYNAYGISKLCLIGAAAPAWVKDEHWQYGYTKEEVDTMIKGAYNDRGKLISDTRDLFFYQYITKPFGEWFFDICISGSGWATAKSLMALRDEQLFNDLPKLKIPTLILHGTHDKICPYPFAEYMNKSIGNSTLIPLTESGHGAFYEEREKVNQSLVAFINQR